MAITYPLNLIAKDQFFVEYFDRKLLLVLVSVNQEDLRNQSPKNGRITFAKFPFPNTFSLLK